MGRVLGAVTIGQSPRIDLIPEMRFVMAQDVRVLEAGALDGLTLEEVKKLAPELGDDVLVTRMADGTAVRIAEKHIIPRMQEKIDELVGRGADAIALVCTGEFPQFRCDKLLVVPQKVLFHAVAGVAGMAETQARSSGGQSSGVHADGGCGRAFKLGVFLPDADQIEQGMRRWSAITPQVRIGAASPYGQPVEIEAQAHALREWGADLIVMDCIGYTLAMKDRVRHIVGVPVILARSVLARTLAELA
ncbi:MAG: AroM family protein [Bacillota bacterium]